MMEARIYCLLFAQGLCKCHAIVMPILSVKCKFFILYIAGSCQNEMHLLPEHAALSASAFCFELVKYKTEQNNELTVRDNMSICWFCRGSCRLDKFFYKAELWLTLLGTVWNIVLLISAVRQRN